MPTTSLPSLARSTRTLKLLMAASLVVPAILFATAAVFDRARVQDHALRELERAADLMHEHTVNVMALADVVLRQTDTLSAGMGWGEIRQSRQLHDFLRVTTEQSPELSSLWMVDPTGQHSLSALVFPAPDLGVADRSYFRTLRDGEADVAVSEPIMGRVSGEVQFTLARRRASPDGRFDGVVAAAVNVKRLVHVFQSAASGLNHSAGLVRSDGVFLVRDAAVPPIAPERPALASRYFLEAIATADRGTFEGVSQVDEVRRFVAYRKVEGYPLYVMLAVGKDAVLRDWWINMALYGALCLAAAVSLFLGSAVALRRARAEQAAVANWTREVERRQQAEQALVQAQKMEAVGQLSGGIAHDFNNLLQALSGCLTLIARRAPQPELAPLLEAGQQAVERGAKLTQQLLAFARRQALRPEPIHVGDRLLGLSELLARALRADIELRLDLEPDLWAVEVDPTQFDLALLNLAVNARDAMTGAGTLVIQARNVAGAGGAIPGDHVLLSVRDTGSGMPAEVMARAFEPFFTTKGPGRGSGLGLSQVHGFARQSGGTAILSSAPGAGTTVTLALPRSRKAPVAKAPPAAARAKDGAGLRVLLVEDDPIVAAIMDATLAELGYAVTRASAAAEALALLEGGLAADLLFTDVVMPGSMNGLDLARTVRALRPALPILLTTGYSEGLAAGHGFHILPKPYTRDLLTEALGAVTEGAPGVRPASAAAHRAAE